jgi:hypothetical protein
VNLPVSAYANIDEALVVSEGECAAETFPDESTGALVR